MAPCTLSGSLQLPTLIIRALVVTLLWPPIAVTLILVVALMMVLTLALTLILALTLTPVLGPGSRPFSPMKIAVEMRGDQP